jgi:hypothetical protein
MGIKVVNGYYVLTPGPLTQEEQDAYDVFGVDEKGRPPLLGKWQDMREAEELERTATRH